MATQYLDLAGLKLYDEKIKGVITTKVGEEETRATGVEGTLGSLKTEDKSNLVAAINELSDKIGEVDYSGKADKVDGATAGNFAGLDAEGNLTDSGKKAADFADATEFSTYKTTNDAAVKANKDAIDAINDEATGILAVAKKYTDDEIDKVEAVIGEVAEGETVVSLIADAKKAGTDADAHLEAYKTTNDAAVKAAQDAADAAQEDATDALTKIGTEKTETEEGTGIYGRIEELEAAIGEGGGVAQQIKAAIEALDATVTNAVEEGAQPDVVVSVVEEDGKLTSVTATVTAERFDAYGAASAVQGETEETVASVDAKVTAINDSTTGILAQAKTYAEEQASAVQGETTETVASVDAKVKGIKDGLGTAAAANVATVAIGTADEAKDALPTVGQVETYVTNEIKDLEGAMHFVGVITRNEGETDEQAIARVVTEPKAGDVVVMSDNGKEYIYSGSAWREVGDEGLYVQKSTTIAGVDLQDNITKDEMINALSIGTGYKVKETDVTVKEYIDSRIFVGSQEEYEAAIAEGTIDTTTFVVITDDDAETLEPISESDIEDLFK